MPTDVVYLVGKVVKIALEGQNFELSYFDILNYWKLHPPDTPYWSKISKKIDQKLTIIKKTISQEIWWGYDQYTRSQKKILGGGLIYPPCEGNRDNKRWQNHSDYSAKKSKNTWSPSPYKKKE